MKIAIVGAGISGLVAAHRLHERHDITVFEAGNHIGGHTHTHKIDLAGRIWAIDTGFIVFNDWTYPNFISLLDELGVQSQPSLMSFSVKCEKSGLEYNGTSLNTLFAQRRNLLSPRFHRMILDILRFNREAPGFLAAGDDNVKLGEYLNLNAYGKAFREHYIIPMGAAIWSAGPRMMLDFPARYFIRFFHNHGMLSIDHRPQWCVIRGGSASYVEPLTAAFRENIRLGAGVVAVSRDDDGVTVRTSVGETERFDVAVLACHSDQALAMLEQPSAAEREILGSMDYQENSAILHTDIRVLPATQLAWAAWNYHIPRMDTDRVAVTYNMNILQGLDAPETFCVSLNHDDQIDPDRIIKRMIYHHPVYTPKSVANQNRHSEISGLNRTYYAGAYWGFGFHEDGVRSGLRVAGQINDGS